MGIRFQCHHCGHQLHVKDFQAGKKGRCPACRGPFRIPLSDAQFSLDPQVDDIATNASSDVGLPAVGTSTGANSTAATTSAKTASNRPAMAKLKEDVTQSDPTPAQNERADLQSQAAIDPIQPQVIIEAPDATWYVRPASGGQYGPAPAAIVWQWLIEDRIGHDSLVWRDDWPEWLSANQVFSQHFSSGSYSHPTHSQPEADTVQSPLMQPDIRTDQQSVQPSSVPPHPNDPADTGSDHISAGIAKPSGSIATSTTTRELRKRNRRKKYAVAIAVLALILVSLAIGLFVVLYQQGVLGGSAE